MGGKGSEYQYEPKISLKNTAILRYMFSAYKKNTLL
jgi:hypothetical protein